MDVKYGLISADSHAQLESDAFTSRMSYQKWGDDIPHLVETADPAHMAVKYDIPVERWVVGGQIAERRGVSNCPTVMDDPLRKTFPQRWDDVPQTVYNPKSRLTELDRDRIDAEVLFANPPAQQGTFFQRDAAFELDCVRAYNDALADWRVASDRYAPLALVPYMSDVSVAVEEVERAVGAGHRGIVILGEPSQVLKGLRHLNDPYWEPLWSVCEGLGVPVHWHARAGMAFGMKTWDGFSRTQSQAVDGTFGFAVQMQAVVSLLFSGILDRHPGLKWVCAEAGLGWVVHVLESCDHEWERRRLWTEGFLNRPSDLFRHHMVADFWYETVGIQVRHLIGIENIMWESDFPHSTSTFPDSWEFVDRTMQGVPESEKRSMLCDNARRIYQL